MPSAKFYSFFVPFAALLAINVLEPVRHAEMTEIEKIFGPDTWSPAPGCPSYKESDIADSAQLMKFSIEQTKQMLAVSCRTCALGLQKFGCANISGH